MRVFVCNRRLDSRSVDKLLAQLIEASDNFIAVLREDKHTDDWKDKVEGKFRESDFVLFLLGKETFESEHLIWEFQKAKELNKRILGLELPTATPESKLYCEGFQVFTNAKDCAAYLSKTFTDDRQLLIEQYRIMVSSTEKVTEQRLSVNNLFFTVTSSVVSVALIIAKTFEFSNIGLAGMILFLALALVLTIFWQKLVTSYGLLNKGKFAMIDEIEKRLRTNLFEREWVILRQDLQYKPNSETESTIVDWFRYLIVLLIAGALVFWALRSSEVDNFLWNYFSPPIPLIPATVLMMDLLGSF
jgi:hypothetical protein